MAAKKLLSAVFVACALLASSLTGQAQVNNYIVGPQDVLSIALFDQPELGGKYAVEADGTFTFPLIGRVRAGGKTLRAVEEEMRKMLLDGYFRNPQLTVSVEQFRSQRVHVVGEVKTPGTYALTGDMSLIEVIARAGSTTPDAGSEVLILRSPDVIRIDLKELQSGTLSNAVQLRDGDTVSVPRAELIYVSGQVRNPGSFALQRGMTVLQAISLAGGFTDRGADNRINANRMVNGKRTEVRVRLEDLVQPGDTIVVPEKFF